MSRSGTQRIEDHSDDLPDPDVAAQEIAGDLQAALERSPSITGTVKQSIVA